MFFILMATDNNCAPAEAIAVDLASARLFSRKSSFARRCESKLDQWIPRSVVYLFDRILYQLRVLVSDTAAAYSVSGGGMSHPVCGRGPAQPNIRLDPLIDDLAPARAGRRRIRPRSIASDVLQILDALEPLLIFRCCAASPWAEAQCHGGLYGTPA
jgi:hypothetical protein